MFELILIFSGVIVLALLLGFLGFSFFFFLGSKLYGYEFSWKKSLQIYAGYLVLQNLIKGNR